MRQASGAFDDVAHSAGVEVPHPFFGRLLGLACAIEPGPQARDLGLKDGLCIDANGRITRLAAPGKIPLQVLIERKAGQSVEVFFGTLDHAIHLVVNPTRLFARSAFTPVLGRHRGKEAVPRKHVLGRRGRGEWRGHWHGHGERQDAWNNCTFLHVRKVAQLIHSASRDQRPRIARIGSLKEIRAMSKQVATLTVAEMSAEIERAVAAAFKTQSSSQVISLRGELMLHLSEIRSALQEVLRKRVANKQRAHRTSISLAERAYQQAKEDTTHVPTALDMERARRALRRR